VGGVLGACDYNMIRRDFNCSDISVEEMGAASEMRGGGLFP